MKVCGIVAEYNPFHNGHSYHIEKARQAGATHIVAVMSGNVVQRGSVAIFDKHFRAKKACENGANLVIELPCPLSGSSGEILERGAVRILKGLGVVDFICFGSETNDTDLLFKAAECTINLENSDYVKKLTKSGLSYPSAVAQACRELYGGEMADLISSPNNTLGIEYIKAAKKLGWDVSFEAVERKGAAHDSKAVGEGIASASLIREKILGGEDYSELLPYSCESEQTFDMNEMTKAVVFKFRSMSLDEICEIPDCTKELGIRICKLLKSFTPVTLDELYDALKTKNITHARIRRVILNGILGIKSTDLLISPYARILAADDKGMELLSTVKQKGSIAVSHSLSKLSEMGEGEKRLAQLDVLSSQFQKMCGDGDYPNEFSVKFEKSV